MRLTEEQFELVSELASRFPFYGSIMTPSNRTFSCFSLDGFQGEDIKSRFLYAVNKLPSTCADLNELLKTDSYMGRSLFILVNFCTEFFTLYAPTHRIVFSALSDRLEDLLKLRDHLKKESDSMDSSLTSGFRHKVLMHNRLVNKYAERCHRAFPLHDLSKIETYLIYDYRYTLIPKDQRTEYEQKALDHAVYQHVTCASHHPEYWTHTSLVGYTRENFCPNGIVEALDMPLGALEEMCADWCATAEYYKNTPFEWADKVINVYWKFSPRQISYIYRTLEEMWYAPKKSCNIIDIIGDVRERLFHVKL